MNTHPRLSAVLLAGALALSACGGGSASDGSGSTGNDRSTSSAPTTSADEPSTDQQGGDNATDVTIADFSFDPDQVEVAVGDTVTFENTDDATHTATAEDGDPDSFDTGELATGDSKEVTFDEPGDYEYYCSIHDYMKGTIRVVG